MQINIKKAVEQLQAGGLVAFPTETVYGLGADATNPAAIQRIFAAKERPADHPLIVHLADMAQLSDWAQSISPEAWQLAKAFWPGPMTLILKKQPWVLNEVTGGQDTVGLRIPAQPVAHELLKAFGGGVAAPSANKFTHISPTTAAAVREELGDRVDMILDGGACEIGLESTIIDMSGHQPVVLRPGMLTVEEIAAVLSMPVSLHRQDTPAIRAPGMHHVHYAPTTTTVVLSANNIHDFFGTLKPEQLPLALVTYSGIRHSLPHIVELSDDPRKYAHDLYHTLRELDHQGFKQLVVEAVPEGVAWDAIRDRLNKAAGLR